MRIEDQKNGRPTDADRIALAALLIKAGYTVRARSETKGKSTIKKWFVEAEGDSSDVKL